LLAIGVRDTTAGAISVGFHDAGAWTGPPGFEGEVTRTFVKVGDATCGPIIRLIALPPGVKSPRYPAHAHASDNFRMAVRGRFFMGRKTYEEGEFRVQEGWRPYPGDSYAEGDSGGWLLLFFADRRGQRGRFVSDRGMTQTAEARVAAQAMYAWEQSAGDLVSDDPADGSGPSAIATTLGRIDKSAHIDGTFYEASAWTPYDNGSAASVTLLGDPEAGPVIVTTSVGPGLVCPPASGFATEVFRLLARGSCNGDDRYRQRGDALVVRPGGSPLRATTGADGAGELVVFGDRRALMSDRSSDPWEASVQDAVAELARDLTDPARHQRRRP
jgi:hypothetical protein